MQMNYNPLSVLRDRASWAGHDAASEIPTQATVALFPTFPEMCSLPKPFYLPHILYLLLSPLSPPISRSWVSWYQFSLSHTVVSIRAVTGIVRTSTGRGKSSWGGRVSPDSLCEPAAGSVLPFKPEAVTAAEPNNARISLKMGAPRCHTAGAGCVPRGYAFTFTWSVSK